MACNSILNEIDKQFLNNNENTVVIDDLVYCNNYINTISSDLKIFHLNIRSINKKFSEFCVLLDNFSFLFDIIILTETWLDHDVGFNIDGYRKYVKINKYNKCDGIIVYFRDNIAVSNINIDISLCNSIHFSFSLNDNPVMLTAIYRSPNLCKNEFLNNLEHFLNVTKDVKNHIILGDINIQILDNNLDNFGNVYLNTMHEYGYLKYLNAITRSSFGSNSCLDHIFLKTATNLNFKCGVYTSAITDHYMTFALLSIPDKNDSRNPTEPLLKNKQIIKHDILISHINKVSWNSVFDCEDADTCFNNFYIILRNLISKCTVSISHSVPRRYKNIKPWITAGIVKSIRTRDKLAKQVKVQRENKELLAYYKKYRNTLTHVIRNMKIKHFSKKFLDNRNDPKKFWQTINQATDTQCN